MDRTGEAPAGAGGALARARKGCQRPGCRFNRGGVLACFAFYRVQAASVGQNSLTALRAEHRADVSNPTLASSPRSSGGLLPANVIGQRGQTTPLLALPADASIMVQRPLSLSLAACFIRDGTRPGLSLCSLRPWPLDPCPFTVDPPLSLPLPAVSINVTRRGAPSPWMPCKSLAPAAA